MATGSRRSATRCCKVLHRVLKFHRSIRTLYVVTHTISPSSGENLSAGRSSRRSTSASRPRRSASRRPCESQTVGSTVERHLRLEPSTAGVGTKRAPEAVCHVDPRNTPSPRGILASRGLAYAPNMPPTSALTRRRLKRKRDVAGAIWPRDDRSGGRTGSRCSRRIFGERSAS